jgi:uncharacterized protein (DUF1684 family)
LSNQGNFVTELEHFRTARIARLRSASGWLSLVGKAFLSRGTTTIGSATSSGALLPQGAPPHVGSVHVDGKVVRFEAHPDVDVRCDGERVTSRVLRSDHDGKADTLVVDGILLELMERGDALALRIRDTRELPRPFAGIGMFPPDPSWAIPARLEVSAEPRIVDLDYEGAIGPVVDHFVSPGHLVFEHEGMPHRLEVVYEDSSRRRLFILFRDATSGKESYPLGRLLYAPLPDEDGAVVLDFNRALLPGCAFTVFATCPIPSAENSLAIAVRAGEREYLGPAVGT